MRPETLAIHAGYDGDPTTKAAAVPIYQTVAFEFDSAEHAAGLFNLELEGYRYSRISNPTVAVLEKRLAALEGGSGALCVSSGQAALHHAILTLADQGRNIVSVPQLYGTTHTLFMHVLPRLGIQVKFAASDRADDIAKIIDEQTVAVFCESVGIRRGTFAILKPLPARRMRRAYPLSSTTPWQRRYYCGRLSLAPMW
jgi:O-acetylhomoserine (thiol)-lyase